MVPALKFWLFGAFQAFLGETPLTYAFTPRLQAFVAYLLLHRQPVPSRQQVAFHFWPDTTDAQARANLRKQVHRLHRAFPNIEHYLETDNSTLRWRPEAPPWLDVDEFERRLQQVEAAEGPRQAELLKAALALYRGELLPDLYDDWVLPLRERLRQRYLDALDQLIALQEAQRDYAAASESVLLLLRADPLRESAYRCLMRLHALSGDVAAALHTYHSCATLLEQELGVEPGPDTQQLHRQLLNRQAFAEPRPTARSPRQLPLVGRNRSWQALLAAWRAAAAGPQVAIVAGEAGIGKTRLAEELLMWATRQGISTLHTACFAGADRLPLAPVAGWLRSEAAQRALPALAARWRSEVARVLPEVLAADADLEMPRPMTEAWQRQHLFMALAEAVTAAGEPLLLFLDDLHWADADTLEWLHFLARHKAQHRFLLLATFRSEEVPPDHPLVPWQEELSGLLGVLRLSLKRLDTEANAALAAHLAGHPLEEDVAAALYEETEGNPLFTVEMVRAGLTPAGQHLPHRVRSVIELRLGQLSPPARELAGLAATIGGSFTFPLLAAASPLLERQVVDSLDELWQRQVVKEREDNAYDFSHGKIREVALAQLSPARRQWWHGRVAFALEQRSAEEPDTLHSRIATHWEAAGQPQQAVEHYLLAARAASGVYAHREAVRQLQHALALLPARHPRRAEAHARLGESRLTLGQYDEAASAFQQAATEAVEWLEKVKLLVRLVLALSGGGRFGEAEAAYRKALDVLERIPAAQWDAATWRVWLDLQLSLLDVYYFQNKSDEMQQLSHSMAEPVETHGTAWQRAQYLIFLGRTRSRLLRFRLTNAEVTDRRAAFELVRQTGDENLISDHRFGLGFTLLWAGRPAEAARELQQAVAQAKRLGNVPLQNRCLTYLSIAHRMQNDEAQVGEVIEQGIAVAEAEGNPNYLGVAEAQRAWLAGRRDDKVAVGHHGAAALAHWNSVSPPYPMQWLARLPLLAVALEEDEVASARAHAHAMLVPPQQHLPDALTDTLDAAVRVNDLSKVAAYLHQACLLAREHNYL